MEQLELFAEKESQKYQEPHRYIIPRMTENPAVTYSMLRRWIIDFHKKNDIMPLPKGFYKRNKRQLKGMFYGMLRHYKISLDDIIAD